MAWAAHPHEDIGIKIEAQGNLLAVAHTTTVPRPSGGGRRGLVTGFSSASRRRLLKRLARLRPQKTTFITLTYPQSFPDAVKAKTHLRALFERFRRRFPEMSAIWRLEFQQRGAPHFHLLCFNMGYLAFSELRAMWSEIIKEHVDHQEPFVRIEAIRSQRGAMKYAAKYCAKVPDHGEDQSFFNDVAYLHAGRVWGIFNAALLPYAAKAFVTVWGQDGRGLPEIKRMLRRFWRRMNKARFKGGVIFTDRAYTLHNSAVRLALHYSSTGRVLNEIVAVSS